MDRLVYSVVGRWAIVAGPRERLIQGAIELMRERGVHATGLSDLLDRSNTARGSIYQHFPAGKTELMEQATLVAGRILTARIEALARALSPEDAIRAFIEGWKQNLIESEFTGGCPIVAAAQAGPDALAVREASATVFADWARVIADSIEAKGVDAATAAQLGSFIVSAVEGAIMQSRSARSVHPLDDASAGLTLLLRGVGADWQSGLNV
ncbi:TetR/AcrR family transcriptional regulator [Mycobacterium sp. DL440]|uniref:TetR/AcrR family transcriptional regulator n=1 Tax=Mycobacterium sp. DL440 TaxID=2675523 RepID=UPI001422EBCF|nr:TetR/AcrR family transcriptional regulator [Mycobacterium sp. DL440]